MISPTNVAYEVRTGAGALMLNTYDRKRAVAFAKARTGEFPGIHVDVVERYEIRRTTWKPRKPVTATVEVYA